MKNMNIAAFTYHYANYVQEDSIFEISLDLRQ